MDYRAAAESVFMAAVQSVLPGRLIGNLVSLRGQELKVGDKTWDLNSIDRIFVGGAGKASAAMGHYVESILGKRITAGIILTRYGHSCSLKHIDVIEAGHPVPDDNGFEGTKLLKEMAGWANEKDLFILLISGGGSALMADHPGSISSSDILVLNDVLVKSGADIREMNIIRKHLSDVKGGNLARHIWPAECCTIIISDVTGDDPEIIASGPVTADSSTYGDALHIIDYKGIAGKMPPAVIDYLHQGAAGNIPETPKPGDPVFSKTTTIIAGNNMIALRAAEEKANVLGFESYVITSEMFGDPAGACNYIIETSLRYRNDKSVNKPVCLLFGGETALSVSGSGKGGRNQHLALIAAEKLKDLPGITLLAAGTDGNDGNTEMAGAVVDSNTSQVASRKNADLQKYLDNFDSYSFFRITGGHINTGPTLTNVMDIVIVLIE